MADLSREEIKALGRAAGLDIPEPYLTEVTYNLQAIKELLEEATSPGLADVEPLPVIRFPKELA